MLQESVMLICIKAEFVTHDRESTSVISSGAYYSTDNNVPLATSGGRAGEYDCLTLAKSFLEQTEYQFIVQHGVRIMYA